MYLPDNNSYTTSMYSIYQKSINVSVTCASEQNSQILTLSFPNNISVYGNSLSICSLNTEQRNGADKLNENTLSFSAACEAIFSMASGATVNGKPCKKE